MRGGRSKNIFLVYLNIDAFIKRAPMKITVFHVCFCLVYYMNICLECLPGMHIMPNRAAPLFR